MLVFIISVTRITIPIDVNKIINIAFHCLDVKFGQIMTCRKLRCKINKHQIYISRSFPILEPCQENNAQQSNTRNHKCKIP